MTKPQDLKVLITKNIDVETLLSLCAVTFIYPQHLFYIFQNQFPSLLQLCCIFIFNIQRSCINTNRGTSWPRTVCKGYGGRITSSDNSLSHSGSRYMNKICGFQPDEIPYREKSLRFRREISHVTV